MGVQHINADSLSRILVRKCGLKDCSDCGAHNCMLASIAAMRLADVDNECLWTLLEIQQAQRDDPSINRIIIWLENGRSKPKLEELVVENAETRKIVNQWDLLELCEGVLCRWKVVGDNSHSCLQIIIPFALRDDVLMFCHGHSTATHIGRVCSTKHLALHFYWPGMTADIRRWDVLVINVRW